MYQPEATYRIQFHKDFTFKHLKKIIPYLQRLGIKTIYASPVFTAVPGSTHGYDGIDPNSINPEIGTLEELREIAAILRQHNMGWLQDFVPNHMAFSPQNTWLCDFLEKGKMSFYDTFFDKNPHEPLMTPFLGTTLPEALQEGALTLVFSRGKLQFRYFETEYPLNYTAYYDVLAHEQFAALPFSSILSAIDALSQITLKQDFDDHWQVMLNELNEVLAADNILQAFQKGIDNISRDTLLMARLADQQFYRLCYWKETDSKINYRRFFTVNSLICMQMQLPEVFETYHKLLLQLVQEDIIQGIRIDHVDGLYDPAGYLEQLRDRAGPSVYIVVEKILAREECLPEQWPVQGSTGYDFTAAVNQVLTCTRSEQAFSAHYQETGAENASIPVLARHYKHKILQEHMQGELSNLLRTFLAVPGLELPDGISEGTIREVIAAVLVWCPVYRFYPDALPLIKEEARSFRALIAAIEEQAVVPEEALRFFSDCFVVRSMRKEEEFNQALLRFWRRCMQLSGPLMAKGVEDTLMYNYNRFLAHNEVGDDPGSFGITIDHFHTLMEERRQQQPFTLNATATHDTKRGEDGRARLQQLSAIPDKWLELVDACTGDQENDGLSQADKYLLVQAVYAALVPGADSVSYKDRLKAYVQKAAREAKSRSGWASPDEQYEDALYRYAVALSDPGQQAGKIMHDFVKEQQQPAVINMLAQLVLKLTCPGIPDSYQGTEWYDFSFVDPDNRRPVDYEARDVLLQSFEEERFDPLALLEDPASPGIKMYTLYRLLQLRRAVPELFAKGTYEPVKLHDHCLSFTRRYREEHICVVVPTGGGKEMPSISTVLKHQALKGKWQDVFTGKILTDSTGEPERWPVLVLQLVQEPAFRNAGILMPLFSLPSGYGIGTMGKEARSFIGFLSEAGQKIWQLLPLNPLLPENSFSPYASSSAFAGEPVYIDPEQLVAEGLLQPDDLYVAQLPAGDKVNYKKVVASRDILFRKAWQQFCVGSFATLEREFGLFKSSEKDWLDDYALFVVLHERQGRPWYEWPATLRNRDGYAITQVWSEERDALSYQQFLQFLFYRQWHSVQEFAAQHNVQLLGDVPFYMSHDSADVWAHPELFSLDSEGRMLHVAGVPPDYFSATGQLWGMPTYNWQALQQESYTWWRNRLRKNTELYDRVRLDHFRAFYDYWEIPAGADTAVDGTWRKGPQDDLFLLLQQQFPGMPFIAEDLGEIHQGVFDFKDRFRLPGMRVLQFGFVDYKSDQRDLPHNFTAGSVVYTGTHDNNTIKGWYEGLSPEDRQALSDYAGYKITSGNVAAAMYRMAYASVAGTVILPLQDLLGLDDNSRINVPATSGGNWLWRLLPGQLRKELGLELQSLCRLYNR